MDVSGITGSSAFADAIKSKSVSPAQDGEAVPFAKVFNELLNSTESQQRNVDGEVQRLLAGESSNFHEISLAIAKADLSFRFMMQIRDQLIGTYREVMKMQI